MSKAESRESVWQSRVNPSMGREAHKIIDSFPEVDRYSEIELCASLHLYVRNEISYEKRGFAGGNPRDYRPPEEVWRIGGNCGEQTILLASLMCSVGGIETRTMGLSREDNRIGHRLLEVKFLNYPDNVVDILKNFYGRTTRYTVEEPYFVWTCHPDNRYTWMIADPRMSSHLGDYSSLESKGYIDDFEDTWEWYQLDSEYYL